MKRRSNKKDSPCSSDETNYDETILDDYLKKVGCKAPYQKTKKNMKVCNSTEKMKEASFNKFQKGTKMACESTETITFDYQKVNFELKGPDWFHFNIGFPDRFEEIVMVQAVDIQTAIGNAGGYIGLFLGKSRFYLSSLINHLFRIFSINIMIFIFLVGYTFLQLADFLEYLRGVWCRWITAIVVRFKS